MELFKNIPDDFKAYEQWVLWRLEQTESGKPTKVPYSPNGGLASVVESKTWGTFNQCIDAMFKYMGTYTGIGFVLTQKDPFCFIDLDKPTNQDEVLLQQQIFDNTQSYAEYSPSGNGLHILCRASLPTGKRKHSVEIYTSGRYMTMTGNVYRNAPVHNHQQIAYSLWEYFGGNDVNQQAYEQPSVRIEDDQIIIDRAASAENGELFKDLYCGDWEKHSHKWRDNSQSCADQALINIIQFYTKDHAQIMRIFRTSFLGRRDKAKRDGYLKTCIRKAFDRDFPKVDSAMLLAQMEKELLEKTKNKSQNENDLEKIGLNGFSKSDPENLENQFEVVNVPQHVSQSNLNDNNSQSPFSLPPGLTGEIAKFIHDHSPRPVPEIAIGAAIGMLAGITGRAYNISGTGLNQYVLVLAPTGTGKEAANSGIQTLLNATKPFVPTIADFIGPTVISSPQALIKKLHKHPSFVSLVGEFGSRLQIMTQRNAMGADKGLLIAFLDLFNKSGHGQAFGAMAYSDGDKNLEPINAPAFSLFGESTPDTFYRAIDETTISSGLVPRFTVIEYLGDRPHLNENRAKITDNYHLIDKLAKLAAQCSMLNSQNKVITVQTDTESEKVLKQYNLFADDQIRGKSEETRQVWNRAHLKVLKLSALLAVGINPYNPVVTLDLVNWAIAVENENIKRILFKFASGSVGSMSDINENAQTKCITSIIRDWLTKPWQELEKYKPGPKHLHDIKVIPYKYILARATCTQAFKDDRIGATNAIKRTLKTLEETGEIIATKDKFQFQTNQLVYCIQNPKHFI